MDQKTPETLVEKPSAHIALQRLGPSLEWTSDYKSPYGATGLAVMDTNAIKDICHATANMKKANALQSDKLGPMEMFEHLGAKNKRTIIIPRCVYNEYMTLGNGQYGYLDMMHEKGKLTVNSNPELQDNPHRKEFARYLNQLKANDDLRCYPSITKMIKEELDKPEKLRGGVVIVDTGVLKGTLTKPPQNGIVYVKNKPDGTLMHENGIPRAKTAWGSERGQGLGDPAIIKLSKALYRHLGENRMPQRFTVISNDTKLQAKISENIGNNASMKPSEIVQRRLYSLAAALRDGETALRHGGTVDGIGYINDVCFNALKLSIESDKTRLHSLTTLDNKDREEIKDFQDWFKDTDNSKNHEARKRIGFDPKREQDAANRNSSANGRS